MNFNTLILYTQQDAKKQLIKKYLVKLETQCKALLGLGKAFRPPKTDPSSSYSSYSVLQCERTFHIFFNLFFTRLTNKVNGTIECSLLFSRSKNALFRHNPNPSSCWHRPTQGYFTASTACWQTIEAYLKTCESRTLAGALYASTLNLRSIVKSTGKNRGEGKVIPGLQLIKRHAMQTWRGVKG
jgi:hypothetical protein